MYGGYQFTNVAHGFNIDAGIFMSYVGLFSYGKFDNWAYQPSYVEVTYHDHPDRSIDKMAFSFTADGGCEFGKSQTSAAGWYQQGVSCHGNTKDPNSLGSVAQLPPRTYIIGIRPQNLRPESTPSRALSAT
jgi:hypothetical protein